MNPAIPKAHLNVEMYCTHSVLSTSFIVNTPQTFMHLKKNPSNWWMGIWSPSWLFRPLIFYLSKDLQFCSTVFIFSLQVISLSDDREWKIKYYIQSKQNTHSQHSLGFLVTKLSPQSIEKWFKWKLGEEEAYSGNRSQWVKHFYRCRMFYWIIIGLWWPHHIS